MSAIKLDCTCRGVAQALAFGLATWQDPPWPKLLAIAADVLVQMLSERMPSPPTLTVEVDPALPFATAELRGANHTVRMINIGCT